MSRALVVEDDQAVARAIRVLLEREGHAVTTCHSGAAALDEVTSWSPDLVVLDIRLPPPDGLEVCRRFREMGIQAPILVLTGRGAVQDRIAGLEAGADDYLQKPFDVGELRARIRAVVRRGGHRPVEHRLVAGGVSMDIATRTVTRGQRVIQLTTREFELLRALMQRPGQVLSRDYLRETVWGYTREVDHRVIDVYIRYLRSKIDEPFGTRTIETVRGVGYRLMAGRG